MQSCELCGRKFPTLINAIVEGSMLSVCEDCSKFDNVITIKQPEIQEERQERTIKIEKPEDTEIIIPDFHNKIKEARDLIGFTQEEVAKKLAEKESLIQNLESGHLKPSLDLVKKFENFFHIKLTYKYQEQRIKTLSLNDPKVTIGDLIKKKDE